MSSLATQLRVLYEDNHLIAVYKPAGVLTQGDSSGEPCLLEAVRAYLKDKYQKPGNTFVGLLHRLDRPVAGVVLFAKTSKGASRLSEQIRQHSVRKTYFALVEGKPEFDQAGLVHYLADASVGERVAVSRKEVPGARRAELEYRTRSCGRGFSVLEIDLKTGRKHQIRSQLAFIGHPIVGDRKYGSRERFQNGIGLVASSFEFSHPVRKEERIRVALDVEPVKEWAAWL